MGKPYYRKEDAAMLDSACRCLQGSKNSLTQFGDVLAKELEERQGRNLEVTLLQYLDDILLGTETEMQCKECLY